MMGFDARDITKSNLELRHIKQQSISGGIADSDDVAVNESRWHGTSKSSYQDLGPVRLIVRHSRAVDENINGSRSRNIDSIFLENSVGERWLLPFKNLHGARAMAQHVGSSGKLDDELGEGITAMCREMNDMARFVRGVRNRQFEDTETQGMAQAAMKHYSNIKARLKAISGRRGYQHYAETYMAEVEPDETMDVDALKERFVKKIYDDRITQALPYVYRAYQKQKNQESTPESREFAGWVESVAQPSWAEPDSDDDQDRLTDIMSKPITVGTNGDNAIGLLHDIIGDDDLNDALAELGDEDPEAVARPVVQQWLDANMPELAAKFRTGYDIPDDEEHTDQPNQTQGATTMDEPDISESLDFIRSLAGLR